MPRTKKTEKKEIPEKIVKSDDQPVKKEAKAAKTAKKVKTKKESAKPVKSIAPAAGEAPEPGAEKLEIINEFRVKEGDTGSPEVQVALLTKRLEKLVVHLKTNPSDNHSRRGLLGIVSKRRRLLNYLEKKDGIRYKEVLKKLGLNK